MADVTLKPCPFCGGEASKRLFYGGRYGVYCDECSSRVGGLCDTEAEAIEAWNTRAELGSGTCKNLEKRNANLWFICSKCGAESGNGTYSKKWMHQDHTDEECAEYDGEPFNYCPNCGAKAVER